jgi:hypothetical protein
MSQPYTEIPCTGRNKTRDAENKPQEETSSSNFGCIIT